MGLRGHVPTGVGSRQLPQKLQHSGVQTGHSYRPFSDFAMARPGPIRSGASASLASTSMRLRSMVRYLATMTRSAARVIAV